VGIAGRVLLDGDEAGDAAAFGEDLAHAMAGRLGRGHAHVDALGGTMVLKWMLKPCANSSSLPGVRLGRSLRHTTWPCGLIGHQDHHHVGPLGRFGDGADTSSRPSAPWRWTSS
jgi:hypothetical protein